MHLSHGTANSGYKGYEKNNNGFKRINEKGFYELRSYYNNLKSKKTNK